VEEPSVDMLLAYIRTALFAMTLVYIGRTERILQVLLICRDESCKRLIHASHPLTWSIKFSTDNAANLQVTQRDGLVATRT
jgi:hypothetical protein